MGINNKLFNETKTTKLLLKFCIPAIISLLALELDNMVDTIFVGRYVGAAALGALTVAFPIQRFLTSLGMLIAVGASTYVARSLGEKNMENLKQTIINAFMLAITVSAAASLLIFIFRDSVIYGLGARTDIFSLAKDYISIILISAIFQCIATVACYVMTALGNTRVSLYTNILSAIINILINCILVGFMDWGIYGAAVSTVVSQIAALGFALYKFKKVKKSFKLDFRFKNMIGSLRADFLIGIITIGFSTFVIEISDAVVAAILNNLLVSEGGDAAIITVGVITKVSMFMFIAIIGISSSMQPIVAYNYGAQNYKKMKEALKVTLITVSAASLSFWLILMVFTRSILSFFLTDAAILEDAVEAFRICISVMPAIGAYYVCLYYYQAVEDSKKSFLLSIYRQIVIFIPVAILFVQLFGIVGAWIAYPVSDLMSSATSVYYIKKAFSSDYEETEEDLIADELLLSQKYSR